MFSGNGAFEVSFFAEIEDHDRHILFGALGERFGVHDAQVLGEGFFESQLGIEDGVRILLRVGAVYSADFRRLEDDVALEFESALRGGGVGGDEWASGSPR